MWSYRKPLLAVAASLLIALAGCGGGPSIVEVTGTLTYKGQPVTNAFVYLVPENGGGRPSWGQTDEQGRFKLNYDRGHDGALIGKHTVSVRARPVTHAENLAALRGQQLPLSKDMTEFFNKYSVEKSKVEVVIDKNTKELKLDWD
jgi:hypothetical protein